MMNTVNTIMWRTQDILHKKPQLVPGTLMGLAGSLIVYRHMTHQSHHESDHVKTFLAMVLVQMLPLMILEMKIMSCADPVGLFCKFATPVTLIHAVFLGLRLCTHYNYDQGDLVVSGAAFVGAFVAIFLGFRQGWSSIFLCQAVWSLVGLAFVAAACTTSLDAYMNNTAWKIETWSEYFNTVVETSNSYIEIVSFVPAVWIIFKDQSGRFQVESTDTKRTATAFFIFLVGFYLSEDLLHAYQAYEVYWMASVAHIAHFLLLVDFGFFVLAHIYNPEKLVGELRKWLPVDFDHEV